MGQVMCLAAHRTHSLYHEFPFFCSVIIGGMYKETKQKKNAIITPTFLRFNDLIIFRHSVCRLAFIFRSRLPVVVQLQRNTFARSIRSSVSPNNNRSMSQDPDLVVHEYLGRN